jgi:serine/threonine protein kinase
MASWLTRCATHRAYGKVYKAKHKETDFLMAIKCINLDGISQQESRQLMKEIGVLKTCRSTHIVSYFSSCFRKNCLWVRVFVTCIHLHAST